MTERHISVPVSLIEGLLDDYGNRRKKAKRDAQARLDSLIDPEDGQPTCREAYVGYEGGEGSCERILGHPGPHYSGRWGSWTL
jgi:hypothetical protein